MAGVVTEVSADFAGVPLTRVLGCLVFGVCSTIELSGVTSSSVNAELSASGSRSPSSFLLRPRLGGVGLLFDGGVVLHLEKSGVPFVTSDSALGEASFIGVVAFFAYPSTRNVWTPSVRAIVGDV